MPHMVANRVNHSQAQDSVKISRLLRKVKLDERLPDRILAQTEGESAFQERDQSKQRK